MNMNDWLNEKFDLDHDGRLSPLEHGMKDAFLNQVLSDEDVPSDNQAADDSDSYDSGYVGTGSSYASSNKNNQETPFDMEQFKAQMEASERESQLYGGIGWVLVIAGITITIRGAEVTGILIFGIIILLIGIVFVAAAKR